MNTDTETTTTTVAGGDGVQATETAQTPVTQPGTETAQATDTAATDDKAAGTEGDDKPEGAPEEYADFTLPEGMELDAKALEEFTPVAKELNLTQDQAQKLVDFYAGQVKAMGEGSAETAEKWYAERRQAEIAEANVKGLEAIKADPELGGEKFDAVKSRVSEAVGAVGTPELRAEFDRLGLGNNPEIVRFVHRLIDYTPQDRGIGHSTAGSAASDAPLSRRMYPNMK